MLFTTDKRVHNLQLSADCPEGIRVADPDPLLLQFSALPNGRRLLDGNPQDCQEALEVLLDALHAELVRQ